MKMCILIRWSVGGWNTGKLIETLEFTNIFGYVFVWFHETKYIFQLSPVFAPPMCAGGHVANAIKMFARDFFFD